MTRLLAAWTGAILIVGACLAPWTLVTTRAQVFSARTEAVRVDVLVRDAGVPILGLRPQDFEVLDDGVPQRVELMSVEQISLNVILVLDVSESVIGERREHLRRASQTLLGGLTPADQSALITVNATVRLAAPLARDTSRIRAAIDRIDPQGATAMHDAVYSSFVLADSDAGRGLVVVFTDGIDTRSYLTREAVLDTARRTDAVVYAASVGRGQKRLLEDVTKQTIGRLLRLDSTKDLSQTFLSILNQFRQRYLLSYSPQGVAREGWHELTVRLKGGRRGKVDARPGYLAGVAPGR